MPSKTCFGGAALISSRPSAAEIRGSVARILNASGNAAGEERDTK
jgi:hypothetical protein